MSGFSAPEEVDEQTMQHLSKATSSKCPEGNGTAGASSSSSAKPKPFIPPSSSSRASKLPALSRIVAKFRGQEHSVYRELNRDKKEIRLLVVRPGSGDEIVSAAFKHVYLSARRKPKYETISYTWGDPTQRSTIYVHGKSLNVPASSEAALRRMRYDDKACVLWIDAICINQDDISERGHQVGIMADIYGSTGRNLIWLGEDDRYTEAALDSIEALNEEFRRETNDFSNVHDTLFTFEGRPKFASKQLVAKVDFEALGHFYTRPWFSRLWVVQEAALAPRSDVFCGRHQIALRFILRAARWISYRNTSDHGSSGDFYRTCSAIFNYADHDYGRFTTTASFMGMDHLLSNLRGFSATEPKDHVFALLGLWQKHHPNKMLPASLEPDYSISLSDVLHRATRFAIRERGDLDVLRAVCHRIDEIDLGLSTWMPRWRENFSADHDAEPIYPYHEWPRACEVLMNFGTDGSLSVNGAILDDVKQVPLPVTRHRPARAPLSYWSEIESILRGDLGFDLEVAERMICEFARMAAESSRNQEAVLLPKWKSFVEEAGDACKPGLNCPRTEEFQNLFLFSLGLFKVSDRRSFFITSSEFFGFGPQTMREEDVLAILEGFYVPAVLRPSESYPGDYEFVGHAAVHGIMKGEAVYKMWDERKDYYRIKLR